MRKPFPDTPEYRKEKEYLALKKQKYRRYYKIKDSVELKDFLEFDKSYDVKHYHTLEKLVQSEEFGRLRKEMGKKKFRNNAGIRKVSGIYRSLKKSERIRDYFRFKLSRDYVNFTLLIGSEKIDAFEQLKNTSEARNLKK